MRTLAIDLGSRRVGLALSDQGGKFATPHDVLNVSSADEALAPIADLILKEGIERIVLGLPLNMDDSAGPAAKAVQQWGQKLHGRCGIPITFVDERLSSFEAAGRLSDRSKAGEKMTRARKKRMLDAHAAAAILQEFLDGRLPAIAMDATKRTADHADDADTGEPKSGPSA